jgi:hypothetical protein
MPRDPSLPVSPADAHAALLTALDASSAASPAELSEIVASLSPDAAIDALRVICELLGLTSDEGAPTR